MISSFTGHDSQELFRSLQHLVLHRIYKFWSPHASLNKFGKTLLCDEAINLTDLYYLYNFDFFLT